ncbi:MAG TPA: arsenate reductase ArsC [Anaerolineae bacterium]|nr:arsenate reductase ArsC [Anaerolineae bacterium]
MTEGGVDVAAGHQVGDPPTRVLFVCTHNSARSIMAEALLREKGGEAYEAFSAGTEVAEVRPLTLAVLREAGIPTEGLRSKSVREFMGQRFDYVITVCDTARQNCPVFPGEGERFHWGYPDPSQAEGSEEERLEAFRRVFTALSQRIDLFMSVLGKHQTDDGD